MFQCLIFSGCREWKHTHIHTHTHTHTHTNTHTHKHKTTTVVCSIYQGIKAPCISMSSVNKYDWLRKCDERVVNACTVSWYCRQQLILALWDYIADNIYILYVMHKPWMWTIHRLHCFPTFLSEKELPDFAVIRNRIALCLQIVLAETACHMANVGITGLSESKLCSAFCFAWSMALASNPWIVCANAVPCFDIACKMEAYLSWCRPSLHHD